jgi:hypothetical protein
MGKPPRCSLALTDEGAPANVRAAAMVLQLSAVSAAYALVFDNQ